MIRRALPEAPRPVPQPRLAALLFLAIALILIGKAQSSLFDRARTGVVDWMRPALVATRAPMEGISRWVGSIGEIFWVYQENLKLKEDNARLIVAYLADRGFLK